MLRVYGTFFPQSCSATIGVVSDGTEVGQLQHNGSRDRRRLYRWAPWKPWKYGRGSTNCTGLRIYDASAWTIRVPLWDLKWACPVSIPTSVWSSYNTCVGGKTTILRMGWSVLLKLLDFWDGPSLTNSHWFRVGIIIPTVDLNYPECWCNCSMSQLLPPQSVLDPCLYCSSSMWGFGSQDIQTNFLIYIYFFCPSTQHHSQLNPVSHVRRVPPKEITFHTGSTQ